MGFRPRRAGTRDGRGKGGFRVLYALRRGVAIFPKGMSRLRGAGCRRLGLASPARAVGQFVTVGRPSASFGDLLVCGGGAVAASGLRPVRPRHLYGRFLGRGAARSLSRGPLFPGVRTDDVFHGRQLISVDCGAVLRHRLGPATGQALGAWTGHCAGYVVLLHPPFGTALGVYTLWTLLAGRSGVEYSTWRPARLGQGNGRRRAPVFLSLPVRKTAVWRPTLAGGPARMGHPL